MNPTILKIFEYAYLLIALFLLGNTYLEWETNRDKAQLYLVMAGIALLLFFFRRVYRKRFERYKNKE